MKRPTAKSIVLSLLAGAGTLAASAQSPKIVVGIMVDQLRTDYIEQLRPLFGEGGFNRLIADGVYLPDVDFRGTAKDAPSGAAIVYTGAWPVTNGVASAEVIDLSQKKNVPVLAADPKKLKPDYSPENLRLSTIADEFFITNGKLAKVYSIAGDPQVAVVEAGHAGGAAIYLDESGGRWSVPAYYTQSPPFLANRNRVAPLSSKITASTWRPLNPASAYPGGPTWNDGDFNYGFSGGGRDAMARYKESALFNSEVTGLAIDLLKTLQPSTTNAPGMVNIAYSLAPVSFDYDGDNRPELTDAYMRLDVELSRLIDAIYSNYGKDNAVIFLSSTGYAHEPSIPEADARIPSGEITLRKAEGLLNAYLSAEYGNGDYVALIRDGKLYLDLREVEKKNIDIRKLRAEVKEFLLKMGGVSEALTLDEVVRGENSRARDLALGIDPKNSPDLFLFFTPGWTVTDDNAYPETSEKVRLASPPTPAFIVSPGLAPQNVSYTVEATALAPTIAGAVNIRAPNGAAAKPINLRTKSHK